MATTVNYASTPRNGQGALSAANTNRDGTGTLVDVCAAGASGTRLDTVTIMATQATTAGAVRLFIYNGSTNNMIDEIPVGAVTPVLGSLAPFKEVITYDNGLILPPNYILKASTNNAETFKVHAQGGDY